MPRTPANTTLGRKLAAPYQRSTCTIKRKTQAGWVIVATRVPIMVMDTSERPMRPDPYDAGTDNTRKWNVSFREGTDVRMRDQIHDARTLSGDVLPILTVSTQFETDLRTSKWIVAQAEDSAVMKEWITFWRDGLTESDPPVSRGPYECSVDWEDLAGYDPDSYNARSHTTFAILTGPEDMDVHHTDLVEQVDGRRGFVVIEVRKAIAGRKEVRIRGDSGFRD